MKRGTGEGCRTGEGGAWRERESEGGERKYEREEGREMGRDTEKGRDIERGEREKGKEDTLGVNLGGHQGVFVM